MFEHRFSVIFQQEYLIKEIVTSLQNLWSQQKQKSHNSFNVSSLFYFLTELCEPDICMKIIMFV